MWFDGQLLAPSSTPTNRNIRIKITLLTYNLLILIRIVVWMVPGGECIGAGGGGRCPHCAEPGLGDGVVRVHLDGDGVGAGEGAGHLGIAELLAVVTEGDLYVVIGAGGVVFHVECFECQLDSRTLRCT